MAASAGAYVCPDHKTCVPSAAEFTSCPGVKGTHWDVSLSVAERVAYVVNRTTVKEQAAQLWNWAPALYDPPMPAFNWLDDDEHGVKQHHATSFPNGGSLGSTWSPATLAAVGNAVATEARGLLNGFVRSGNRGMYENGVGITLYAPNMNLVRDPRWGRAQEVYSEDPELSSALVTAFVEGIQARHANGSMLAAACCKHYAFYDLENEPVTRFVFDARVNAANTWETYLAVFRHCIVTAKGASVMASYNAVNGVPTAADPNLLNGVLRDRWGFEGFVVGDYDAAANIVNTHHYCPDYECAAAAAWNAGLDQEGGGVDVISAIPDAVAAGKLSASTVAASFGRLLRTRILLGLFDPPTYSAYNAIDNSTKYVESPAHKQLAFTAAVQGTCLYKNARNALPLDASTVQLAVIGPQAAEQALLQGNYAVAPDAGVVTLLEGLGAYVSGQNESRSCAFEADTDYYLAGQAGVAASSPAVCCSMCSWNPECAVWTWYESQCYLKPAGLKPTHSPGRVSGKPVPSGSPRVTFAPGCNAVGCSDESGFAAAGTLAAAADAVIVVLGLNQTFERETHDRTTIDFPQGQYDLVSYLRSVTTAPLIGVLVHGGTLAFHDMVDNLDAIVDVWYPGEEGGNALAAVVFGAANPAGRTPVTYYAGDWQLPQPGNMDLFSGLGTTYRYFVGEPVFPFGHGLSYTTFAYSDLRLPTAAIAPCAGFTATVRVTNTGKRDGDEVVQLYVSLPDATVPTAHIRLAAFARVGIAAGASVDVALDVSAERLSVVYNGTATSGPGLWQPTLAVEAGAVHVGVGGGQPHFYHGALEGVVTVASSSTACNFGA
ncbi:glycoside hydrolase family 3 domain-containing protein [Thecamonas trahens ATCC 50062]|uniref:Glycoside hydrolase family 3 domain-containing protein n=1 Tax=Thecamonas trahens ATCC 50062 TaxID=461836 RepID=A0A0L0DUN8_THETB|nr:glycoside hydrolase family 3 domain-containing protein [Thecamonas trahens ATCC 50062]KNC55776.1 glycoside hydrolase family 3 domain-containing protein [Thecamonas trahens ATCC 50062]|eukprot:XP_013752858.1 glycoside hydrolase family 3 domain-containing protein [Thecamonas trahens ATCC 50062]